ncbi:MAG: helix-turn-helix domain-containing protein [Muribaculaceae bacterium]|nr:helix-turn-helix domain-containing protein [Muribaculaceae bacterium]MDE6194002.1 helix-turn-helix domain-containing protein [Muribaculaceae bacterium]MDE6857078.1 helix-turn-helix domain-containing protein [Muribaculaceae bacterium]
MDKKELGYIIKTRRKALKIDQQTLALLAGVGINTVVAVERGDGNPKISTILSLLDTMGLQIKVILKDLDL